MEKSDDELINDIVRNSDLVSRFGPMAQTGRDGVTFAKVTTPLGIETVEARWDIDSTVESVAEDLLSQAAAKIGP